MSRIKYMILQASVICSFVCIITKILDWYNPYMDFSGHVWFVQVCLDVLVILLALLVRYKNSSVEKRKSKKL